MKIKLHKVSQMLSILKDALAGNLFSLKCRWDIRVRKHIDVSPKVDDLLWVSLTSYGYRAEHCVVNTIYSFVKQRVRPAKILLWLAEDEFSEHNLPQDLVFLKQYGLDIRFCEDLRSYKKLIPTLRLKEKVNVMTVDDDIYYSSNMIETFLKTAALHPHAIIVGHAFMPLLKAQGAFAPYTSWKPLFNVQRDEEYDHHLVFPIGYSGIYYPASIFDDEVLNSDVFLHYAPYADDVWFYVMGLRQGVQKVLIPKSPIRYYLTDLFRQKRQKDRLHDVNFGEGKNDIQLKSLLNHYQLRITSHQ